MSLESIAGPLIGGGLGLLSGGGESGPTVTRPYIPKDREDAYARQLKDALKIYETQFDPRPTMRVANTYPTNQFEGLFRNPELGELQRRSDQTFFESLLQPQTENTKPQEDPQALADMESRMIARQYLGELGDPRQATLYNPRGAKDAQMREYLKNEVIGQDQAKLGELGRYVQGIQGLSAIQDLNERDAKQMELEDKYKQYAALLTGKRSLAAKMQGEATKNYSSPLNNTQPSIDWRVMMGGGA